MPSSHGKKTNVATISRSVRLANVLTRVRADDSGCTKRKRRNADGVARLTRGASICIIGDFLG